MLSAALPRTQEGAVAPGAQAPGQGPWPLLRPTLTLTGANPKGDVTGHNQEC